MEESGEDPTYPFIGRLKIGPLLETYRQFVIPSLYPLERSKAERLRSLKSEYEKRI